jgi:hypothetical protein
MQAGAKKHQLLLGTNDFKFHLACDKALTFMCCKHGLLCRFLQNAAFTTTVPWFLHLLLHHDFSATILIDGGWYDPELFVVICRGAWVGHMDPNKLSRSTAHRKELDGKASTIKIRSELANYIQC